MTGAAGSAELERRHRNLRSAAEGAEVDAVLVCGSEYTGFEGALRYVSGFELVHRYGSYLLPLSGEPVAVFPSEARWVGNHDGLAASELVFAPSPGEWLRDHCRRHGIGRVGVYGLDLVMPVRDYRLLAGNGPELVDFDLAFDLARAVKSAEELASVAASMRLIEAGLAAVLAGYRPGVSEAEVMAGVERVFVAGGSARRTMNIMLGGPQGIALPEFRLPDASRPIVPGDLLLFSLEVAASGGHWVELSRPVCDAALPEPTSAMLDAYVEYAAIARRELRAGVTAHEAHIAVARPFLERGFTLGHVTGHSIGMTMIEHPRVAEGVDVELRADMVVSMHPHAISRDERAAFYMQDTWHIGPDGALPLSDAPLEVFDSGRDGWEPGQ